MRLCLLVLVVAACGSSPGGAGPDATGGADSGSGGSGSGSGSGGEMKVTSTLTSACATLQGRALVNYNGNFGIAFTESDTPYTFLGSVQFQLPDGFTGAVPDPEAWDGSSDRHAVAMTTAAYELHGNQCWSTTTPPAGSLIVHTFDPTAGVVKATFTAFALHSCTGSTVCTVSGEIATKP